ncbi:MAG: SMP-30/gluconolactonase/LRE family protein [Nitrospirae bacterium]|nr:SMP-30/gluconolactonase/LRE family protein [Nitrospirota bacterium]
MERMNSSVKPGGFRLLRLFLLLLLAVSVYAGTAFGASYTYVSTLGVKGLAVAVDGSGNLYVAEMDNHIIEKYNSSGIYVNTLGVTGETGTDNSHFDNPTAVAVDGSGNVYVADTNNLRIQKYDSSGSYVSTLDGAGEGSFNFPQGVAVDGSGNVYVSDTNNHRILKYNSSGTYVSTLGVTGVPGTDNSHFDQPQQMAVDGSGNLYVADMRNHRIQKFKSDGTYLDTLGVSNELGTDNNHLYYPYGVAVDGSGNVYVADTVNHRIQKFDPTGGYVATLGVTLDPGSDNSHFSSPTGTAVDGSNNLYVADQGNNRIQKYSQSVSVVPAKLTLISPSGTIVTNVPQYRWNSVSASSYSISVWVDGKAVFSRSYTAAEVNCSGGGACYITPSFNIKSGSSARWWVRGVNDGGAGSWSEPLEFAVSAPVLPGKPTLISPIDTINTKSPQYKWNSVATATSYVISIWVDGKSMFGGTFTANQAGCASGGECSVTPPLAVNFGASARWWVRAINGVGAGSWSTPLNFTVVDPIPAAPTLISPSGTTASHTPEYRWNSVNIATSYWISIWIDGKSMFSRSYTAAEVNCSGGGECYITPSLNINSGSSVRFWVRGINGAGAGSWSIPNSFTVD